VPFLCACSLKFRKSHCDIHVLIAVSVDRRLKCLEHKTDLLPPYTWSFILFDFVISTSSIKTAAIRWPVKYPIMERRVDFPASRRSDYAQQFALNLHRNYAIKSRNRDLALHICLLRFLIRRLEHCSIFPFSRYFHYYSYRRASIGLILVARYAGYVPQITPSDMANNKPITQVWVLLQKALNPGLR